METEPLFDTLVEMYRDAIGANSARLYVLDDTGENLVWVAGSGYKENYVPKKVTIRLQSDGLVGWVYKAKEAKIARSSQELDSYFEEMEEPERSQLVSSVLSVPLKNKEDKVIGVLSAEINKNSESQRFSDVDMVIASSFAQLAAIALDFQRENSQLKKIIYAFVLMPFDPSFDDIYNYGIKKPIENLGITCERVDEIQFNGGILDKVFECIDKARFVIADMTGRNPNVFYEVGYCHAINKEIILCTQSVDDIPFDLRGYNHIVYSGKINELEEAILKRVLHLINQEKSHKDRT